MNRDLVRMFGKKLDSFTISDYHGLSSPGLTCYLNSVLQVFFMTEDFREAVKRCCSKDSTTIDPQLQKLFAVLHKTVAQTHHITKKLGIKNVFEQRDAAEYFEKILCLTSPEAAKMFKGELNHITTCLECKDRNNSRSFFWLLPLAVEDLHRQTFSVEKGLAAFFKGEKVSGDNKMYCNRCNKKQDADFGCEITQYPEILTLLLERFSFDYKLRCYVKLHCKVDVPQTLLMEKCTYDLYALVHHFGNLSGGHYTAQIKSFETHMWYHFNDDIVNMVKAPLFGAGNQSLRSGTAYLLMYRRANRHPEESDEGDQEALCAHSDVAALRCCQSIVPHQLKDESCNRRESFMHLNGDIFKKSPDDTVGKKYPNFSGELEKGPHEEIWLQTNTGADEDSLQRQRSDFAKLQKMEDKKVMIQSESSLIQTHRSTFSVLTPERAPEHISERTRSTTNLQKQSVAKVRTEGKTNQRREAGDVKSRLVSSNGFSSSTVPYLTGHVRTPITGCNYSPNLCRKSNGSKRDKEILQHVVSADSRLATTQTASCREKRNAIKSSDKAKTEPRR